MNKWFNYLSSFHELGIYDLPVMIDYILNYTGHKRLNYIGHSMGTTALFVLLSMKPEYNEKISFGICLAPIAFWINYPIVLTTALNNVSPIQVGHIKLT